MRRLVVAVGAVAVLAVLAAAAFVAYVALVYSRAAIDTVGDVTFDTPLRIPPIHQGTVDADGTRVFDLEVQTGTTQLLPGVDTPSWGVNGAHLGPTVRARRGDTVRMDVTNRLPESTTLHWHGMHLPASADGGPHSPIRPGATWSPTWTIDQPAASLWYHPHPHGRTTEHVLRGVVGMLIVDDDHADGLGLPDTYGVDDVPVIVHDVSLDTDGTIDTGASMFSSLGPLGEHVLVNGTHGPYFEVTATSTRLRLLNASAGRIFEFGFDDGRAFELIATDGGLLDGPRRLDTIVLSPGERAEIVVEMAPGTTTALRSTPPRLGERAGGFEARFSGLHDRFDVLELRAGDELRPSAPVPDRLGRWNAPDPREAVTTRTIALEGRSRINGRSMDMGRIDHVALAGTTELWEVRNDSGTIHNLHVHDVQFRVLDLDGAPPPPHLAGPKDTLLLPPRATARIVMRFGDHVDPDVPYMFHCHILRHEDDGMMGQFTVVDDDAEQRPGRRPSRVHDHRAAAPRR